MFTSGLSWSDRNVFSFIVTFAREWHHLCAKQVQGSKKRHFSRDKRSEEMIDACVL